MLVKTMAQKITEKSYPVAVACLSAEFMFRPISQVVGSYLVINETAPLTEDRGGNKTVSIGNVCVTAEDFKENYEFVDPELKTNFTEVRRR